MSHYTFEDYQHAEQNGKFPCPAEGCDYTTPSWKGLAVHFGKTHDGKLGKIQFTCDWCGDNEARWPSNLIGDSKFCSKSCQSKWMGSEWYGKDHPSWNQESVQCTNCGTSLTRMQSELNKRGIYFCNSECQGEYYSGENNHAWEGGHDYLYGHGWRQQRRKALERDGYVCEICDQKQEEEIARRGKGLEVHHIVPFREFGVENHEEANQLQNLATLCRPCHQDVEAGEVELA